MSFNEQLSTAQAHFRRGQWAEAEAICRQVLRADPGHITTLNLLAILLSKQQRHDDALIVARQAIAADARNASAYGTLGNLLRASGRMDEAIAAYQQTVRLAPQMAVGQYNLGVTLFQAGRLDEASVALRTTCQLDRSIAPAHACLGVVYRDQGNPLGAVEHWRQAVHLRPGDVETWHLLGVTLVQLERYEEAVVALQTAVSSPPPRGSRSAPSYLSLGLALAMSGRLEEGIAAFEEATRLDPAQADSCEVLLGNVWFARGSLDAAVECYQRAVRLNPLNVHAHLNLGNIMRDLGRPSQAVDHYRDALKLQPDFAAVHSNLLFASQYCTGVSLAILAESHASYDQQQAALVRASNTLGRAYHARKQTLRIGFVSPDLGRHPVGFFLAPLLEQLRGHAVETFCYCDRFRQDAMTSRLRTAATHWRDVKPLRDARLAEHIRSDEVDILFDLAGHTANNRLLTFARKPAPVQITWAGYVGSTGLLEMDYLLADRFHVPTGAEPFYSERVLRMPNGYICYEPPQDAPPVGPLPALSTGGAITFGCFNHPAKITAEVVSVWASLLRRVPTSRLLLKYNKWTNASAVARVASLFAAHDVDPARLDFQGSAKHAHWLGAYNRVDLALDPFPYSGGMTTCEALWMGVPVITCPGETFASRHSLSHSSNASLLIGIAINHDDYVARAAALANNLPHLAEIRSHLRPTMAGAPLCNAPQFATDFVELLRAL